MSVREIITNEVQGSFLRTPSARVGNLDPIILANIIIDLIDTMREHNSDGIAAIQIGLPIAIIAMELDTHGLILINPSIVEVSEDNLIGQENCLSVPNVRGLSSCPRAVIVDYEDIERQQCRIIFRDKNAFTFNHLMNHLEGVVIERQE